LRRAHGPGGLALFAVELHVDIAIGKTAFRFGALQRRQRHALLACRTVAVLRQGKRAGPDFLLEAGGLDHVVHQPPILGALPSHALDQRAEDVRVVVAHSALVGDAGQSARARQHAQQGHLGQRNGRRAVVDQEDLIAGQGQFIAAPRARAIQRRDELQAAVAAGVFDAVTGFIGELAEVDLPGVGGQPQHENVGAGTEDAVFHAGDDHAAHFGVFEADALQGVVQFDIDAQVVRIELELVAGAKAAVFGHVHGQGRDGTVESQAPVPVLGGIGPEVDPVDGTAHRVSPRTPCSLTGKILHYMNYYAD